MPQAPRSGTGVGLAASDQPRAAVHSTTAAPTPASAGRGMHTGPVPTPWLLLVASGGCRKKGRSGSRCRSVWGSTGSSSLAPCKEEFAPGRNGSQACLAEGCSPSPRTFLCHVEMLQLKGWLVVYGTHPAPAFLAAPTPAIGWLRIHVSLGRDILIKNTH